MNSGGSSDEHCRRREECRVVAPGPAPVNLGDSVPTLAVTHGGKCDTCYKGTHNVRTME